jgi:hypothetical protein
MVFPKVISDGTRDTLIEITNVTDTVRYANCYYGNASPTVPGVCSTTVSQGCAVDPDCPDGEVCVHWAITDFALVLTAQQPTAWSVQTGLLPSVPPRGTDFTGELLCVEVDSMGTPTSGNSFIGEATLTDASNGLATYNAIGLRGFGTNNGDNVLCLGGSISAACPNGAEYEGCPASWTLDHVLDGLEDDLVGASSIISTDLTVVPCSQDFETQTAPRTLLWMRVVNEFEQQFSVGGIRGNPWLNVPLGRISPVLTSTIGASAQTRMFPSSMYSGGVIIAAEEFHSTGGPQPVTGSAAVNARPQGTWATGDTIILPPRF